MKTIPIKNLIEKSAVVDDDDYDRVMGFRWRGKRQNSKWHIVRTERVNGKSKIIYMRRQILDIDEKHVFVKHKNRDTLDHRKENLQIVNAKNAFVYAR